MTVIKHTLISQDREQLLMLLTRAWVVENEDDRILNRETKTDVKEIYDGARKNEVRTFHRDKLTVRRPPVVAKIKKRKEIDDDDFDFDRENDF